MTAKKKLRNLLHFLRNDGKPCSHLGVKIGYLGPDYFLFCTECGRMVMRGLTAKSAWSEYQQRRMEQIDNIEFDILETENRVVYGKESKRESRTLPLFGKGEG